MADREVILNVEHVSKTFTVGPRKVKACSDINLKLFHGQTLGIIGESGSGKSTLAKIILGILPYEEGKVLYRGEEIQANGAEELRQKRKNIQCVFQDAMSSFSPRMKVNEIICEPLYNYGLISKKDYKQKAEELLELVQLPKSYENKYPVQLSGGERQRVNIARAMALNPEIVLLDEATSALDVTIQKKVVKMLVDLQKEHQTSYIFISHDLALAQSVCDYVAVMYKGHIVEIIESGNITQAVHPYTKNLLNSVFSIYGRNKVDQLTYEGADQPADKTEGCVFAPSCAGKCTRCITEEPVPKKLKEHHYVSCFQI